MKKIVIYIVVLLLTVNIMPFSVFAVNNDISFLIGDWSTSDGIYLSFYDDETFELEWGYFGAEEGDWNAKTITGDTFYLDMNGSTVLSLMSMIYGTVSSEYHFEILKCNNDNFYLVQVYDNYTAKTSPCKLPFTREGAKANFGYKKDPPKEQNTDKNTNDDDGVEIRKKVLHFIGKKGKAQLILIGDGICLTDQQRNIVMIWQ